MATSGGKRQGAGRKPGVPNKVTADIRAAAQQHGPAMIAELVRIATKSETDSARVSAIKEMLDRGYGKSAQPMTGEGGQGPILLNIKVEFVKPHDPVSRSP